MSEFSVTETLSGSEYPLNFGKIHLIGEENDYIDTSRASVGSILSKLNQGYTWIEAVKSEYGEDTWISKMISSELRHWFFTTKLKIADGHVLDLGAGWGQVSVPLSRNNRVVSVDANQAKMEFIAKRSEQEGSRKNLCCIVSDFMNLRFALSFDTVILNGVLEWVPQFTTRPSGSEEPQQRAIRSAFNALRPGGCLVIGIENRLGLKYLLGGRDDHIGLSQIMMLEREDAELKYSRMTGKKLKARTRSYLEYRLLLEETGFDKIDFYCAFPDYKLPAIAVHEAEIEDFEYFSYASKELILECDGYDGSEISFNAELYSLYRSLNRMGVLKLFAPSYYIIARK